LLAAAVCRLYPPLVVSAPPSHWQVCHVPLKTINIEINNKKQSKIVGKIK
jgi:hypothetical protein